LKNIFFGESKATWGLEGRITDDEHPRAGTETTKKRGGTLKDNLGLNASEKTFAQNGKGSREIGCKVPKILQDQGELCSAGKKAGSITWIQKKNRKGMLSRQEVRRELERVSKSCIGRREVVEGKGENWDDGVGGLGSYLQRSEGGRTAVA